MPEINLHRVGYCGQSKENDVRFRNSFIKKKLDNLDIDERLIKIKKNSVNMKKVKLYLLKPWITKKLRQLLGFDDEIVMDYMINQLEEKQYPDPKEVQINITGFINGKNAKEFVGELWPMLMSATENGTGIPQSILDAKKREISTRYEPAPVTSTASSSATNKTLPLEKNSVDLRTNRLWQAGKQSLSKLSTNSLKTPNKCSETIEIIDDSDDEKEDFIQKEAVHGAPTNTKSKSTSKVENTNNTVEITDDEEIEFIGDERVETKDDKVDKVDQVDKDDKDEKDKKVDTVEKVDKTPQISADKATSEENINKEDTINDDQKSDTPEIQEILPDAVKDLLQYTEEVNNPTIVSIPSASGGEIEVIEDDESAGKNDEGLILKETAPVTEEIIESFNPEDVKNKAKSDHDKFMKSVKKSADHKSEAKMERGSEQHNTSATSTSTSKRDYKSSSHREHKSRDSSRDKSRSGHKSSRHSDARRDSHSEKSSHSRDVDRRKSDHKDEDRSHKSGHKRRHDDEDDRRLKHKKDRHDDKKKKKRHRKEKKSRRDRSSSSSESD